MASDITDQFHIAVPTTSRILKQIMSQGQLAKIDLSTLDIALRNFLVYILKFGIMLTHALAKGFYFVL